MMHRNKSASAHQFSMIPKAEIPRSKFDAQKTLKTAFDSGYFCLLYTSPSPRDRTRSRMPSSA